MHFIIFYDIRKLESERLLQCRKLFNFTEIKYFVQNKCYSASKNGTHLRKLLVVGVES